MSEKSIKTTKLLFTCGIVGTICGVIMLIAALIDSETISPWFSGLACINLLNGYLFVRLSKQLKKKE